MTIDAANSVCRMHAAGPVPRALVLCMATQANAVGLICGLLSGGDDLRDVSTSIEMKAAIAVALLALHTLLCVVRMLEVLGDLCMAGGAGL